MTIAATVVLIVEDDRNVLDITGLLLESAGYEVVTASNANEGLAAMARRPDIRLICTDVNMPGGMDGIAMIQEVRRRGFDRRILVVSGDIGDARQRMDPDMAFLAKPYDRRALLEAVENALAA
ncbi:MAG TPA: response regulator [Luteibacter sp.]|jgi:DNA-binding NtrC family response regulator|nr:response regulator [Luteibacter sp.]